MSELFFPFNEEVAKLLRKRYPRVKMCPSNAGHWYGQRNLGACDWCSNVEAWRAQNAIANIVNNSHIIPPVPPVDIEQVRNQAKTIRRLLNET